MVPLFLIALTLVFGLVFGRGPARANHLDPSKIIPDVPKDAIPPLDTPEYVTAAEADRWLDDDDIILGFEWNEDARAYPIRIMNWHEIVNDTIGGLEVVVTYCPLCRSGIVFERHLNNGQLLSFGNTGALFESDMVMYDRETESYWFQIRGEAITGKLHGKRMKVLPSNMMLWSDWLELYPDTQVLSLSTGYERPYAIDIYEFQGYNRVNSRPAFPVSIRDDRLRPKETVIGLEIGDQWKAYSITQLGDRVIHDTVGGRDVVVFVREAALSGAVFDPHLNGTRIEFTLQDGQIRDLETGSAWDLRGEAISGPRAGDRLERIPISNTFWFAWVVAFPQTDVYREGR